MGAWSIIVLVVNTRGQGGCMTRPEIVGLMLDANFNSHAFLWKDGGMVDLNDLIPRHGRCNRRPASMHPARSPDKA